MKTDESDFLCKICTEIKNREGKITTKSLFAELNKTNKKKGYWNICDVVFILKNPNQKMQRKK